MFHFYFCSFQWLYFHVCNPQIICLKNKNQKTQTPSALNTLWLSSCVVFTHMWVIGGEVCSRTSSLLSTFLASGFSIASLCHPKAYLSCFISRSPFALVSPSSGCDFDFSLSSALSCAEVQNMCMETVSGLHSESRFLNLKTFSEKIYLIHVADLWVPAGSNVVLVSVLV